MTTNVTRVDRDGNLPIPEDLRFRYRLTPGAELAWRDPGNGTLVLDLKPVHSLTDVRAALIGQTNFETSGPISTRKAIERHIREKHDHASG